MQTATKERPILFSAPMVRAILAGTKTQTRRVVKPQCLWWKHAHKIEDGNWEFSEASTPSSVPASEASGIRCPYGRPGDRLWVKEGVWCYEPLPMGRNGQARWPKFSGEFARDWFDATCEYTSDYDFEMPTQGGALNKMFMPRWASRITLEVVNVRVERVQDISPIDAATEGIALDTAGAIIRSTMSNADRDANTVHLFSLLWDSINGKTYPWASNPWVWVVEFKRVDERKGQA